MQDPKYERVYLEHCVYANKPCRWIVSYKPQAKVLIINFYKNYKIGLGIQNYFPVLWSGILLKFIDFLAYVHIYILKNGESDELARAILTY